MYNKIWTGKGQEIFKYWPKMDRQFEIKYWPERIRTNIKYRPERVRQFKIKYGIERVRQLESKFGPERVGKNSKYWWERVRQIEIKFRLERVGLGGPGLVPALNFEFEYDCDQTPKVQTDFHNWSSQLLFLTVLSQTGYEEWVHNYQQVYAPQSKQCLEHEHFKLVAATVCQLS